MKILTTAQFSLPVILQKIARKRSQESDVLNIVQPVVNAVQKRGDAALKEFTKKYDGAEVNSFKVSPAEVRAAYREISPEVIRALKKAAKAIEKFHKTHIERKSKEIQTIRGVTVWREFRPIEKVGLYIPGGTASYPSTVLMNAIPARVAGCRQIILCTPPNRAGQCNPGVLVAADLCAVSMIYKVGGAQAIAAMAYGTETIPQVYKIFGPGNQYVTTAKMMVFGQVAIDQPAGPSEVAVIADESVNPNWIAADLLSQMEHGENSQALLVTPSFKFGKNVIQAVLRQIKTLPRKTIIQQSFARSFVVVVRTLKEATQLVNEYAPEHLEIVLKNGEGSVLKRIQNAGSVFLGKYSTEPLGDYATGSNHTLPTAGYAKMFPPLSTEAFGKMMQIQRVNQIGLKALKETVEQLANYEGLGAHARAVSIRFSQH
ncbi:MAG: histidinol dehydrogenase, histidinol dehydrogenase [Candidatus Peregrinibacteria bacterium GW2011_GWF2_39_17]|nr:MAG: histidinol dehydrogenase, histidinol dehydrogenase [Candidatus Peregrinibacteria bacterium GW2011_GWF2_39_17]HCW32597.1 histidinol dehydrogenase [Candidatus Peregrinibacteria bacterium]